MDINIPEKIKYLLDRLESRGYEAFIVGGCVRDSLMGIPPADYDITTNASPEEIKDVFSDLKTIDTGIKHGTVTVLYEKESAEVTSYRIDGTYSDNRRPDKVFFTKSLEDDLSRRDFTVNAMAYSDKTGIIDKFGGQQDLFNQYIRCVGDANKRFEEDALRILRALRFASKYNFEIEESTSLAIHQKRGLIKNVSAERIRSEFEQLLYGRNPANILLDYSDVIETFIPEIGKIIGFDTHSLIQVYDVWEHTAHAVENSLNDPYVRLALFFHDIEKPSALVINEDGERIFPKHEIKSANTAKQIMHRLRFDNKTIETVSLLISFHYITPVDDKIVVKKLLSVMGEKNFLRLLEVIRGDCMAKQDFCLETLSVLDVMKSMMRDIIDNNECFSYGSLAVNGIDVLKAGFVGKDIGRVLEHILGLVTEEKLPNERSVLLNEIYKIKAESL